MAEKRKISLVLADVDGTLVTEEKVLTERALKAVSALQSAGIRFAITSGRPPRGMAMSLTRSTSKRRLPGSMAGSLSSATSRSSSKYGPANVARQAIGLMREHGLDTWVYSGNDWLITKIDAPHVAREAWTVKFEPKVVADVGDHLQQVAKIVGVSDDLEYSAARPIPQAAFNSMRRQTGHSLTISMSPTKTQTRCSCGVSRDKSEYRRKRSLPSAINQTTC